MQRITHWFAVIAITNAIGFAGAPVRAQTESVLYTFTEGADGNLPVAGLAIDPQGNLYGTTEFGAAP